MVYVMGYDNNGLNCILFDFGKSIFGMLCLPIQTMQ
jgi:hypothetical protein